MATLSNELSGFIKEQSKDESIISRKLIQLKTLNRAMVFFYIAVACLAISRLIGGLQLSSIKNLFLEKLRNEVKDLNGKTLSI